LKNSSDIPQKKGKDMKVKCKSFRYLSGPFLVTIVFFMSTAGPGEGAAFASQGNARTAQSGEGTAAEHGAIQKGVTELKFSEFFINPIGPKGLQFTEKLRALDGKRVQIVGYMVRQENQTPGTFLLAATPVQLHEEHYGLADDLPAATLFVLDPANRNNPIRYAPGLIRVSGILEIGNREEANGRISVVRLRLDPPPPHRAMKKPLSGKGGANDLVRISPKNLKQ
jgi:hypothetical protein